MAQKYRERVAKSSGVSSKAFQSDFGLRILKKYGWSEGEGLGRQQDGRVECLQATRRELKEGLGVEKRKAEAVWDNWWSDCFNSVAQNIRVPKAGARVEEDSDDDDDEANQGARVTSIKKAGQMQGKLRRVMRQEASADRV